MYVSLFVCLFVYLSVFLFGVLFVCRSMPVCLSVCPSAWLAVCQSIRPSIRPSVRPSVRLSIPLSICRLSVSLSVCLPVCLFLWDFPEIMMTNGWCDCICLFIPQVFIAFSQTAACSALSVVTAKKKSRADVSGASTWTHMGRISFLKWQRKDFTWEESEAITAPFLSKCYSYRKQRKQKFPFPVEYLPWADWFVHWMSWPLSTREQRNKEHEQKFSRFPHCRTQW